MTDNEPTELKTKKSPLIQAQEELENENNKKGVILLKQLLEKKRKAEVIVANIQREIDNAIEAINQGDLEAVKGS